MMSRKQLLELKLFYALAQVGKQFPQKSEFLILYQTALDIESEGSLM